MPFTTKEHRFKPDLENPGDRCYIEYKYLMEEWTRSPRWTTVDELATRLFPDKHERAFFLAFLVFFDQRVMPYERKKREENGDVTI